MNTHEIYKIFYSVTRKCEGVNEYVTNEVIYSAASRLVSEHPATPILTIANSLCSAVGIYRLMLDKQQKEDEDGVSSAAWKLADIFVDVCEAIGIDCSESEKVDLYLTEMKSLAKRWRHDNI